MPRVASDNTFQVTLYLPPAWRLRAEAMAKSLARQGFTVTRAEVLRMAVGEGLAKMEKGKKSRG